MTYRRTSLEPSTAKIKRVLAEQNPWHFDGKVPPGLAMEQERPLARALWRRLLANESRRFQIVLGPRRVGKTTAMYQTVRALLAHGLPASRLWWLRLDHPLLFQTSLEKLVRHVLHETGATTADPVFLFFDELTYGRDWDLWLKTFYDERWPLQVAGTSSSSAALRERHVESGVGRWEAQYLAPYLFDEFLNLSTRHQTWRRKRRLQLPCYRCLGRRSTRPVSARCANAFRSSADFRSCS